MSQEIMDEFVKEFWRSSGVMTFTSIGMSMFAKSINWVDNPENPDPRLTLSRSAPTNPGARADATWRRSEIEGAAVRDGWLQEWISQAWLTLIFSRWEDHYRPLFAESAGVARNHVTSDVMGEIRNLRNDVVHNNGVAGKNARKNKLLVRFDAGERIVLTEEDIWLLTDNLTVSIDG